MQALNKNFRLHFIMDMDFNKVKQTLGREVHVSLSSLTTPGTSRVQAYQLIMLDATNLQVY